MNNDRTTIVDFIAKGVKPDEWKMVLVEEGPWNGSIDENLRRIQERLYGSIDAALDGQLAVRFPETKGKLIILQLDCYNVPQVEVKDFFLRFSEGALCLQDYREALEHSQFVKEISFEINFDNVH